MFKREEIYPGNVVICDKCQKELRGGEHFMHEGNSALCVDCYERGDNIEAEVVGVKADGEKVRMELLPFSALEEIAEVLTYGAKKYAPDNWKKVRDAKPRYTGALLRHLASWQKGEKLDLESGLSHLAHMGANILFLLWYEAADSKI
jgi:hypothetical protein